LCSAISTRNAGSTNGGARSMRGSLAALRSRSVSLTAALRDTARGQRLAIRSSRPASGPGVNHGAAISRWSPWLGSSIWTPSRHRLSCRVRLPCARSPASRTSRAAPKGAPRRSIATMSACSGTSQNGRPPAARPSRPADVRRPRARPER